MYRHTLYSMKKGNHERNLQRSSGLKCKNHSSSAIGTMLVLLQIFISMNRYFKWSDSPLLLCVEWAVLVCKENMNTSTLCVHDNSSSQNLRYQSYCK